MAINPIILSTYGLPDGAILPNSGPYSLPEFRSAEFYFDELVKNLPLFEQEFGKPSGSYNPGRIGEVLKRLTYSWTEHTEQPELASGYISSSLGCNGMAAKILSASLGTIDWRGQLRDFARRAEAKSTAINYSKISRRLGWPLPGRSAKCQPYVPVILDTSLSMTDRVQAGVDEIISVMRVGKVMLYQCDTQLRSKEKLVGASKISITGFGGTNLQPAFDACMNDGCKYILAISDREFNQEPDSYGMQVLWLTIKDCEIKLERF